MVQRESLQGLSRASLLSDTGSRLAEGLGFDDAIKSHGGTNAGTGQVRGPRPK